MKTPPLTRLYAALAAGLALSSVARAQTPATSPPPSDSVPGAATNSAAVTRNRVVLIDPDDKRALVMKATERNPYARRNPDVDLITDNVDQETEADRIRDILNALPISGRSYGPKGLRVLAGEIVFERGKVVDHVIEDQSENLIVEGVKDSTIELAWIDIETGKLTGKRIVLSYDLTPKVRYVLKGQPKSEDATESPKFGLLRSGKPLALNAATATGQPSAPPAPPQPIDQAPGNVAERPIGNASNGTPVEGQ